MSRFKSGNSESTVDLLEGGGGWSLSGQTFAELAENGFRANRVGHVRRGANEEWSRPKETTLLSNLSGF